MFAQRGARTHDPEIKSLMLYRLSQPGYQELFQLSCICIGVAGVVVSCKIPILATRVRFPGDAHTFCLSQLAVPLWIKLVVEMAF